MKKSRQEITREIKNALSILNRPDRPMGRGEVIAIRWAIEVAEKYGIEKNEETGKWELNNAG